MVLNYEVWGGGEFNAQFSTLNMSYKCIYLYQGSLFFPIQTAHWN